MEEKRRQQLLNRHECEIDEQRQEFRRKRDELTKKYEFELQTIDQKQKIEIERENFLLTNEYNRRIKQIRLGSFSTRVIPRSLHASLSVSTSDQEKDFKQFREQLREQVKQLRREYDAAMPTNNGKVFQVSIHKLLSLSSPDQPSAKERSDQLKRYLVEKEDELFRRERQYIDNQQQTLDHHLRNIESYHRERISVIERQYVMDKTNLSRSKEQALWDMDEHELRSRYDLLRKQTKSFYSLFRTMLTQQSDKELQQCDERIRFERETLGEHLAEDKREWPRTWKKMQKTRQKQFKQRLIIDKTSADEEKILTKKVELTDELESAE